MTCTRQTTQKYATRPGPPFKAQSCKNQSKKGNDGENYTSKKASNGVFRWVKHKKNSENGSTMKRKTKSKKSAKRSSAKSSKKSSTKKMSSRMNLRALDNIAWTIFDPISKATKFIDDKFIKLSEKEKNTMVFPTPQSVGISINRNDDVYIYVHLHGTVSQVLQQLRNAYRPHKKAMQDLIFFEGIQKSTKDSKLYIVLGS